MRWVSTSKYKTHLASIIICTSTAPVTALNSRPRFRIDAIQVAFSTDLSSVNLVWYDEDQSLVNPHCIRIKVISANKKLIF